MIVFYQKDRSVPDLFAVQTGHKFKYWLFVIAFLGHNLALLCISISTRKTNSSVFLVLLLILMWSALLVKTARDKRVGSFFFCFCLCLCLCRGSFHLCLCSSENQPLQLHCFPGLFMFVEHLFRFSTWCMPLTMLESNTLNTPFLTALQHSFLSLEAAILLVSDSWCLLK